MDRRAPIANSLGVGCIGWLEETLRSNHRTGRPITGFIIARATLPEAPALAARGVDQAPLGTGGELALVCRQFQLTTRTRSQTLLPRNKFATPWCSSFYLI